MTNEELAACSEGDRVRVFHSPVGVIISLRPRTAQVRFPGSAVADWFYPEEIDLLSAVELLGELADG